MCPMLRIDGGVVAPPPREPFMKSGLRALSAIFLVGACLPAAAAPATAATDNKIEALEAQIQELQKQVQQLKTDTAQQMVEVQAQQQETRKRQASSATVTMTNGRPTISSPDGAFTASLRTLVQADWGYYMQSRAATALPTAYGPDLSSGMNMRRVFLGIQGKIFSDWSYSFIYDFGGPSTETPGHIMGAYLQYDGLAPWAFRIGAYAPPVSIEDSTTSSDLMFLERNSPTTVQRNIAGAEGRESLSIIYAAERLFGAVSLTGDKIADGSKALAAAGATAAPVYDEQTAMIGRLSYLPISNADAHWIVGVNGLDVFRFADSTPNGAASLATTSGATAKNAITLSDLPEFSVDSNGATLINTGALPARHAWSWGLETAANYQNFFVQAAYYAYGVGRAPVAYTTYTSATTSGTTVVQPSNDSFSAWYVQASWIITGERHVYNPATGSFGPPKPTSPFSLKDGTWGAWEIAGRYSDTDLNDHVDDASSLITGWNGAATRTYTFYNTVRGGHQRIVTMAANWYINGNVRLGLDYQWIDTARLQSPASNTTGVLPKVSVGQNLQTIALRAQMGF